MSGARPTTPDAGLLRIAGPELEALARALLQRAGASAGSAEAVAEGLLYASLRGIDSHGIRLLPHYLRALAAGRVRGRPRLRWQAGAAAVATLDADQAFGHAAGAAAMDEAVLRARRVGVAAVAVANSSHFGAAGWYAVRAARRGLLALAFTHADALLRPHGSARAFFGTNPIAFAAPLAGEDPLCLDMATSHVSWNAVLEHRRTGAPLAPGRAVDERAQPTRDASRAASLEPAGGYKGAGLALMVDVLCGLLSGMPVGRDISRMYADPIHQPRRLGHFFVAIDPERFCGADVFRARLAGLVGALRAEPAAERDGPVMAPGDPEKRRLAERSRAGVPLPDALAVELETLALRAGLRPPARLVAGSGDAHTSTRPGAAAHA